MNSYDFTRSVLFAFKGSYYMIDDLRDLLLDAGLERDVAGETASAQFKQLKKLHGVEVLGPMLAKLDEY